MDKPEITGEVRQQRRDREDRVIPADFVHQTHDNHSGDNTDETNHGDAGYGKGKFNADLPFQPIHYKNSFISVVMAAFPFEDNTCHLHSSTFNPMYCGHPILQFGPYQSLREMRERGFKTFGNWWDESYDDEPDHRKRFEKVMDVTLELSKISSKELL